MTKVRVHELAKTLNKSNKEVIDFLREKNVEVSSHMSSLSDEHVEMVKNRFSAPAAEKTDEKKKNIVQVFRPQNTRQGKKTDRPQGQRSDRPQGNYQGQRRDDNRGERRPMNGAPRGERPANNNAPRGERSDRSNFNRQDRTDRPQGQRNNNRPQGNFQGQRRDDNRVERRDDNRRDDRRNDRRDNRRNDGPVIPAPIVPEQKQTRQKAKENYKQKDKEKNYRDNEDGKGGKNKKGGKNIPLQQKTQPKPVEKVEEKIKMITIPEVLTIKELADLMKIQPCVIVKKLFMQGKIVTLNQEVDFETAEEIAMEFEVLCEKEEVVHVIEQLIKEEEED